MEAYAPDTLSPCIPLPGTLGDSFKAAAAQDGLIDGMMPIDLLKSLAEGDAERWADFGLKTGSTAAIATASAATGTMISLAMGPMGLAFAVIMNIDGGRTVSLSIVNALETELTLDVADAHLAYGGVASGFGVGDSTGKVVTPHVIPAANSVTGLPGPMLAMATAIKLTTLGIGFYGTEGALHLRAADTRLLPAGAYLGWRNPETGGNTTGVSVSAYRDSADFYKSCVDDGSTRTTSHNTYGGTMQTDPVTGQAFPKPRILSAISAPDSNQVISMIVYIGTED